MALIKCPDCGRDVSTRAIECPHCGYPLAKNKAVLDKQIPKSSKATPTSSTPKDNDPTPESSKTASSRPDSKGSGTASSTPDSKVGGAASPTSDSKVDGFHLAPSFPGEDKQKDFRKKIRNIALISVGSLLALLILVVQLISGAKDNIKSREEIDQENRETASEKSEIDCEDFTKEENDEYNRFFNNISQLIGMEISESGHTNIDVELYKFTENAELFGIPGFIQGVGGDICTDIFWNANEELTDEEYQHLFDYLKKIYGGDFSTAEYDDWTGYQWKVTGTFDFIQLNKGEENGKLQTFVCFGTSDLESYSEEE